jgi:hypothetical protein
MRRRIVMSMLVGVILSASTFLGAGPASAAPPADAVRPVGTPVRSADQTADTPHDAPAETPTGTASETPSGAAADAPAEFGTDWHDPLTAAPPVARPATKSCAVTVAEAQFRDFTPYRGTYTPPGGCGDRWSKVVLRLDGKVKGRQFDRLGYLHIGGVEILRTSTPEPSPDGIQWSVEKDVTRYSDTFRRAGDVEMLIGNVVDDTYTGVLDVKVALTFYAEGGAVKSAATPDRVLTLQDGTLTTPRNSERIVAEVYATGSGGGCEEYWYLTVPDPAPYSCKADRGPYREVQIKVDGQLAGIAEPFPTVWTGGWSNPFLWYVIPGPRAFDIKPIEYDLTPFAGLLDDGRPHRIDVSVVGVPAGQTGWSAPVDVLVWQDVKRAHVTGALTEARAGDLLDVHARFGRAARHRGRTPADDRRIRRHLARPGVDHRAPHARRHLRAPLDRRGEHGCAQGHLDRRRDGHRRRAGTGRRDAHPSHVHHGRHHDARRGRPVADRPDARRPGRGRRDARWAAHRVVPARRHVRGRRDVYRERAPRPTACGRNDE